MNTSPVMFHRHPHSHHPQHHPRERDSVSDDGGATSALTGLPKNNSDNCLTVQVHSLLESDDIVGPVVSPRKAHSSPTRHPQRRRYSQGAVPHISLWSGNTSAASDDGELFRHSTENLRHVSPDSNPFASTIQLMDHESATSGSASGSESTARRKVSRAPHKFAKRQHWPEEQHHQVPLDDICESPLVKTPNEPAQWSVGNSYLPHTPEDKG